MYPDTLTIKIHYKMHDSSNRIAVVLGSGGHTSEIIKIISSLSPKLSDPSKHVLIYSSGDTLSLSKYESVFGSVSEQFSRIPRARSVGQSYFTSIFTTIYSCLFSMYVLIKFKPKLVILAVSLKIPIVLDYLQWSRYIRYNHFSFLCHFGI